jgi:predicted nucleic acid-binding protein
VDIKLLPAATKCLVDANIIIHHSNGTSVECRDFLHRIAIREIDAYLTTVIIAEVLHRQMLIEALDGGFVPAGRAVRKLKEQPQIIGKLTDHIGQVKRLLKLPFTIISVDTADISKSHRLRSKHHLFVNDSLNLAAAKRNRIRHIITHDSDFERATGITVWSPTDI